jgi:DNA polymerase III, alpha subunit
MEAVEAMGLVKLDILAQGGLSVLRDARAALREKVDPPEPGAWDDPQVWRMIAEGEARGSHHIESPAMTSLARMSGVRAIDQLIAIVSVIRPGAANSLRKEQFARRARGEEPVTYIHPSLEQVLRSTYGVVAYEEHVLQICEVFAGWDAGRADQLRRLLVKNRMAQVDSWREEFAKAARVVGRAEDEIAGRVGFAHEVPRVCLLPGSFDRLWFGGLRGGAVETVLAGGISGLRTDPREGILFPAVLHDRGAAVGDFVRETGDQRRDNKVFRWQGSVSSEREKN